MNALRTSWAAVLVAITLLVGVIAVSLPASAHATEEQDYRGFSAEAPFSHYRVTEWTGQNVAETDGEVAFCFNQRLQPPTSAESNYPVRMTSSYDLLKASNKPGSGTSSAFDNSDEFNDAILRTIYNGYGFNAAGIKERFGLDDGDFYHATQLAVWRYTDNMFTAGGTKEPSADSFVVDDIARQNFNVARAAAALVGQDPEVQLEQHPDDAVIRVYVTDQTPRRAGTVDAAAFQNLLTVEMTHGKDGERVVVDDNKKETQKEEERTPSAMRTTVSVEGEKASADAAVELSAAEVDEAVHVVDTIDYEGFEEGKEYTFTGELMDLGDDRVVAKATKVETVSEAKGSVKVDFDKVTLEPGHSYVVFEKAVRTEAGEVVEGGHEVVHHDREDRAQTIVVKSAPVEVPEQTTSEEPMPSQAPENPTQAPVKPSCPKSPDCAKPDEPKKDEPKKDEPKKDEPAKETEREEEKPETTESETSTPEETTSVNSETSESTTPSSTTRSVAAPGTSTAEKPIRTQGSAPHTTVPHTTAAPSKSAAKEEKRQGLANTGASVITMSIIALVMIFLGGTLVLVRLRTRD
ncbi:thioester-forming surface-anchored protein [Corynebacterium sp. 11A]|uniref:thioester-forming surface-anchored protein n=1 Tax=Corynebacterium sp. 11A TaxID=2080510 RepID=UPI00124EEA6E|nr:thioester-forming surface-anchored protein [Corynebacterium sp. 11A]